MDKKWAKAPLLELGFYYASMPERQALASIVKALLGLGAKLVGEGVALLGPNARDRPFTSGLELPQDLYSEVISFEPSEVEKLLNIKDVRLYTIYLQGASGVGPDDVIEYLMYVDISEIAATKDRHPLAVLAEGMDLSNYNLYKQQKNEEMLQTAKAKGLRVYQRFLQIIKLTDPSYAAITIERDIECPTDMEPSLHSLTLENFYISRSFIGSERMDGIRDLYIDAGAYVEDLESGLYISSWEPFNPTGTSLSYDARTSIPNDLVRIITSIGAPSNKG